MKESQRVKVVVFVPETHADAVRKAVVGPEGCTFVVGEEIEGDS